MCINTNNAQTYQTIKTKLPSKILLNVYKKKKSSSTWNSDDPQNYLEEAV